MSISRKTQSLSFRINAAIWTVCAVLLILFGILFYEFEKRQHESNVALSRILLESIFQQKEVRLANDIFTHHYEALQQTLAEINMVKGISAVHIFSKQGELVAWSGRELRQALSIEIREQLKSAPVFNETMISGRDYLSYTTTIEVVGEFQGYFSIYLDIYDLRWISRQRIMYIVGVFGILLMVLSAMLHLFLTRSVVKPVSRIRAAMNQVMQGRLGEQVSLAREDEIGEVAAVFNAMSLKLEEQRQRLLRSMEMRNSYAGQLEETNRKLASLNADLEGIVEERTRELRTKNEQLRAQIQERIRADQARRALEERLARSQKMEALGLLAGGVAHDLNNVLSGIVSYPELILMDLKGNDPVCKMVAAIQTSGQKAAAIVQDLLTLARRGVSHTSVLNLNDDIIRDYLDSPEFIKMRTYHPGVRIETRLAEELLNIRGSAIHLKKAVMNLVSNAAEAQPDGGSIIISTDNRYVDRPLKGYDEVNEGDYVLLQIKDQGSGIALEDINRIFEPFYTKKKMGRSGTGLGMAVVWGTVQDHYGYINVTSHLNHGTTFDIYFPVTREKAADHRESISIESYMGKGEEVLVIDDVETQREIVATLLTRLNYSVTTVSSGEAALVYLQGKRADILVLDMIMDPGIDGLETYTGILEIHPGQKAIIASGYAESERVKQAQKMGAGAYIRKPYAIEKIGLAIRDELDKT